MKRKSPQVKIPKQKLLFIGIALVVAGFALLFFSIALNSKQEVKTSGNVPEVPADIKPASDSLALAPRPSDKPVPELPPSSPEPAVPDSPKTPDAPPSQPSVPPAPKPMLPVTPPPVSKKSGKLIFIFDDAGNSLKQAKTFLRLPFPITIAVLPGLPESKVTADAVRAAGKEVFLHQPMQAVDLSINPGPGSIQPDMTTGEAARIVRKNIAEIGPIAGMNNHEGSLITADRNLIGAVLDVCIDEKIIFLDSRTSSKTQAPFAAMERGMHIWERDVFLDNTPTMAEMRKMINKGLAIADKKGYAIMIGHIQTPPLAELLLQMYKDLQNQGYVFTTLSGMKK